MARFRLEVQTPSGGVGPNDACKYAQTFVRIVSGFYVEIN
jgi:hypothetical protein